jgi:phenylalanyl-tRNA synthetase beta chain
MAQILQDCGMSLIHPVVDVTNYVMLELGQPMHAFDLAKITGDAILIRNSKQGEKILLLDQTELELKADTLVIADSHTSMAIAGVMGGMDSAISNATSDIFLECAYFTPVPVRLAARDYSLQTDSSYRFERGIDPTMQEYAIERASQLLLEIAGGEISSVLSPDNTAEQFTHKSIKLRSSRIERLLGIKIANNLIEDILSRLNMQIEANQDGWTIIPPAFRSDITIEEDLIEEVARIYGYDNIPSILPIAVLDFKPQQEKIVRIEKVRSCLQARAYSEAITYSFIDEKSAKIFYSQAELLKLANPISEELACMRPSLWPGLVKAVAYNQNRQAAKIRLFEIGTKFIGTKEERKVLAGACYGHFSDCKWVDANRKIDFYDVKGDLEAILYLANHNQYKFIPVIDNQVLHPGQACKILAPTGEELGMLGMLHPSLEKLLDVKGPIFLFEINWDVLCNGNIPTFKKLSKFPAVHRDLALVVDNKFTSEQLLDKLKLHFGDLLASVEIFDIYSGEKIANGKKSIALRLALQHHVRTLVDEEVNLKLDSLLSKLKDQDDISLRT